MSDPLELARLMRGRVPEWGDDYIEKQVPSDILVRMLKGDWIDEDGFNLGFRHVSADKESDGTNICCLANKYMGQGCHEVVYVREGSSVLEKKYC